MPVVPGYVLIADPGSMRFEFYHRELLNFWKARGVTPEIHIVDWRDVAQRDGRIGPLLPSGRSLLRVESPARDPGVIETLLDAGQRAKALSAPAAKNPQHGWIASPALLYAGLCLCLNGLSETLQASPQIQSAASPADIAVLFDKNETTRRLLAAGLPCPETFAPTGNADELLDELHRRGWQKAYVKLSHGSCASGIAVVSTEAPPTAITTVTQSDGDFFNTSAVYEASGRHLTKILEFIIQESATVQQAIPKTQVAGRNFDIRAVVIGGDVVATVFRVSSHPMTNLHLGGARGDADLCRRMIPTRHWLDAMDHCVEAARLFKLPAVGVDLAFHRDTCQPYLLELNAFGDFFPNWTNADGRSIHSMEIENTARRFQLI
ncbi:MAG: STM4014 family protein [Planctomycetaceae bacterium]